MATLSKTTGTLQRGLDRGLHIGAQVFAAIDGRVVADLALGEAAPGHAMGQDTLMCWLSASKPVTAIAVAQLREAGRINWDDPVAEHVPEFAAHGKEGITIRHILTHTAGLRGVRYSFPEDPWPSIMEKICQAKPEPRWRPGEKAGYHPYSAWFILGEVVQRLSGKNYSTYLRRNVFEPAGMTDCWIGMPAETYDRYGQRIGTMMNTAGPAPEPAGLEQREKVVHPSPGTNAFGPARQLGRFYQMLLADGAGDEDQLLEPETVTKLTRRQRKGMYDYTFRHTVDWGLGLIRDSKHHAPGEPAAIPYNFGPYASSRTFGHGGRQSTAAFADPAHNLAVAVICNGMPGEEAHNRRMHEILGALYEDLNLTETD
jgi:CubicO group peptidase (beta-lactamase class C family)